MSSSIGLRAANDLRTGLVFGPYPKNCIFGINSSDNLKTDSDFLVYENDGRLRCAAQFSPNSSRQNQWLLFLLPARDILEQNVQAFNEGDETFFKTIGDIKEGDRLLAWYDQTTSLEIGIPPLIMEDIKGDGSYVCGTCCQRFLFPNPLKAHKRFHCLKQSKECTESTKPKHFSVDWLMSDQSKPVDESPPTNQKSHTYERLRAIQVLQKSKKIINAKLQVERKLWRTQDTEPINNIPKALYCPEGGTDGYLCVFCGKVYSRKYGLKIHLRTHVGYKPLKCNVCGRPFGDPSNLNKHLRLHADQTTPYKCTICQKVLVRKRDLNRHMAAKHGQSTDESCVVVES